MRFIERIKALFPDKFIQKDIRAGRSGSSSVQQARLSHVNAVADDAETGLQLATTRIRTSIASSEGLPTQNLQKTGTRIDWTDGQVMEGWQLTLVGTLDGTSNELSQTRSVTIPGVLVDGKIESEGFYTPWSLTGVTICEQDDGAGGLERVINGLANGAEFNDSGTNFGLQSDSVAVIESDGPSPSVKDFTLLVVTNSVAPNTATGEVVMKFEFLCYEGVTPLLS